TFDVVLHWEILPVGGEWLFRDYRREYATFTSLPIRALRQKGMRGGSGHMRGAEYAGGMLGYQGTKDIYASGIPKTRCEADGIYRRAFGV
ncbi:hypothetical protein ASPFODRAFT_91897, partial [Aspergillus luchuensis CBS 106.47]